MEYDECNNALSSPGPPSQPRRAGDCWSPGNRMRLTPTRAVAVPRGCGPHACRYRAVTTFQAPLHPVPFIQLGIVPISGAASRLAPVLKGRLSVSLCRRAGGAGRQFLRRWPLDWRKGTVRIAPSAPSPPHWWDQVDGRTWRRTSASFPRDTAQLPRGCQRDIASPPPNRGTPRALRLLQLSQPLPNTNNNTSTTPTPNLF